RGSCERQRQPLADQRHVPATVDRQRGLFQPAQIALDQHGIAAGSTAIRSRDQYRHHRPGVHGAPGKMCSAAYCSSTTPLPSTISPRPIMRSASATGSSTPSMSSPSSPTPPPAPALADGSYSATKKWSLSVTEPGLMNASKILRTAPMR